MRLLLDTHIFLWACDVPNKLSEATRHAIADETNLVAVSAATAWEIAIKVNTGRLRFPVQFWSERIATLGVETLPILPGHALAAAPCRTFIMIRLIGCWLRRRGWKDF